jgi:hypothetical protein
MSEKVNYKTVIREILFGAIPTARTHWLTAFPMALLRLCPVIRQRQCLTPDRKNGSFMESRKHGAVGGYDGGKRSEGGYRKGSKSHLGGSIGGETNGVVCRNDIKVQAERLKL